MGQVAYKHSPSPSLLVRPHPFRTEGPKGYLLRLAEMNWIPAIELEGLGIIYELKTFLVNGLMPDQATDPELHEVVATQSCLLSQFPRVWNHRYARFCPYCLAEDAYWRSSWELMFHDACTKHGVWLVDQCSSCGDKVLWQRDSLVRCRCGSDLRTEKANNCPESVGILSEILLRKLQGKPDTPYPSPLEKTDLEQTQRLIRYLGTYMNPLTGRNPLKIQQAGSLSASWPVTSLAAEILREWPNAFTCSLEKIQNDAASAHLPKLGSVFGNAYNYLYRGLKGTAFNPVRQIFETWLSYSWRGGLAKRNKRLALLLLDRATWIPSSIARDILGISPQRLLHLIREGAIEGETYISQSGRKSVMVRSDQLNQLRQDLAGEMDMTAAGVALGLTKKRTRQILTLLFPTAQKTRMSSTSPWRVSRAEVENLIAISKALPNTFIPDEGCVALSHILRYWAWTTEEIATLIIAVRGGDLLPEAYLDGGNGINGWIFKESILNAWRVKSIHGFGTWLSVPQVAKFLGIKQQVAYDIVNKHFLHSEFVHKSRGGTRVHRSQIERFKEEYMFCTEIAQMLGVSPTKARAILAEHGITPVSGPGIDDTRQLLYLRHERLERVLDTVKTKKIESFELLT